MMDASAQICLIGGVDRSGTTLLGALLGNHSRATCVPESIFKENLFSKLQKTGPISRNLFLNELKSYPRFHTWSLPEKELKEGLDSPVKGDGWFVSLSGLFRSEHFPQKDNNPLDFVIDHTPENLRQVRLLRENFQNVKFIHIIRDGRGVARSVMDKDGGPSTIRRVANFWLQKLSHGLAAERFLPKEEIIRVHYEDLLLQTKSTINTICDFLSMDYEPSLLGATQYTESAYKEQRHRHVGKPPQTDRADAWKNELSEREIELFESSTGEMLDHLGYERNYPNTCAYPTRWERWSSYWYEQYRLLVDKFRHRWRRRKIKRET
jgi:hypothetical protein